MNNYSRNKDYSYKKNSNKYKSGSRTYSYSSKKDSGSSNSSESSYSDKSNKLYPYTINEIIKGKYRVNLFFNLFIFLFNIGSKAFIRWYFWKGSSS